MALGIVPPMGIAENLKRLRLDAGMSQGDLAKRAGVSQQLISQLERGENLTTKKLPKILRALNAQVSDVDPDLAHDLSTALSGLSQGSSSAYVEGAELAGRSLEYAGIVEAGAFRPVDEYFTQDGVDVPEYLRANPKFQKARQMVWRVSGSSMDMAGIEDGMWVVGADYGDYLDMYGQLANGTLVVVERSRYEGSERELTVKEAHFFRDRTELHPRSSDPRHKPIVVENNHEIDGLDVTVRILARVLAAYRDFS